MDIFFKHSKDPWVGHPLSNANALDLQELYNKLDKSNSVSSNIIQNINDDTLKILSHEFLQSKERDNVTTQENQPISCVIPDGVSKETEAVSPFAGLPQKTRRGRLIRRPVRLGFDD